MIHSKNSYKGRVNFSRFREQVISYIHNLLRGLTDSTALQRKQCNTMSASINGCVKWYYHTSCTIKKITVFISRKHIQTKTISMIPS